MNDRQPREDQRFSGAVLMAVGALIAGLCGSCTWNQMRSHDELSGLAPIFGGVPTLGGVALFAFGLMKVLEGRGG